MTRRLAVVLCLMQAACVREPDRRRPHPPARIGKLVPEYTRAGVPFQPQPDGESAIAVIGENLGRGCRLQANDRILAPPSGGPRDMAAIVPRELFAQPGTLAIRVVEPNGRASNELQFVVYPASGPPPRITRLFPDSTRAGEGFNVQANGESALGVTGEGFLPQAVVVFAGRELKTNFENPGALGALVPPELYKKEGGVAVTVRNADGKSSPPFKMTIAR